MKKEGSVRGELIFPEKPSKKAVQSSVKILENMMKLDIEYKIDIDKDIIGGFVFKTDKFIVDLSVKYQLQKLKEVVLK
jgi:F0F1-type ATP synthase delta subunit